MSELKSLPLSEMAHNMFPALVKEQYICKTCGHEETRYSRLGDGILLWDLYCIKCLEKFLDENIGKMEEK